MRGCRVINMLAAATYEVPVSSCKSSSTGQEDPQKTYQSILGNLEEYRGEKRSAKQIRNVQKMTAEVRDAPKKKGPSHRDPDQRSIVTSCKEMLLACPPTFDAYVSSDASGN